MLYILRKKNKNNKIFAIILVLALCIDSFGAIVSDNDGSAFVTKAEFDALKSNFNKQIDDYNASIDGKIDGAIASYLSGIQLAKVTDVPNNYSKYVIKGAVNSWPILWSSAKSTSDMNATEKKYFGSDINFRPMVNYAIMQSVLNVKSSGKYAKIWGGSAYEGPIGNAAYNDYIDIYKLSNSGEVVSAFRTTLFLTLLHINDSTRVVSYDPTSTAISGYPYAKITNYDFGNAEVYSNMCSCGRLWPQGANLIGESAMWNCQYDTWSIANKGTTLTDAKSTSFVDNDTTIPPCVYPFGGTSVKVNASKENVAAFTYISRSNGVAQAGESYALGDVLDTIRNQGFGLNVGNANSRNIEWTENITIKHNYYPTGYKCTQTTDASQLVFENFKTVDSRNGKICNGVLLCEVEKKGLLTVRMTPSNKGKIYLWQANASGDTWGGKKSGATINESLFPYNVNVTTAGVVWERSFDVEPTKGPIWLVYAPSAGTTGGSLQGSLNNVEVTLTVED